MRSCIHMTVMHLQHVNLLPSASSMSRSILLEYMHGGLQMVMISSTKLDFQSGQLSMMQQVNG